MASAALAVRVSAQIAEFQKSFATATKTLDKFAGEFEGMATRAAAVGAFFGTIAADIARSLARGLAGALRDAVKFSSEFSNAFVGLSSVARAFGHDTDAVTKAARAMSADGLVPVKNSAQALKNLLSSGFGLPEAIKLLNVAKDSAAFNRQGMLSMGDAVERFTQGIKFNNSALTDSTGLGKNLSQVMKDAGFSLDAAGRAASDAGVRQAILNGFIKEGAAFAGDAAKLTETYSGSVSRLETSYQTLLGTIGNAITQNATVAHAIGAVSDLVSRLTSGLTTNKLAFNLVSDAVILTVKSISFMAHAVSGAITAVNALDTGFAAMARNVARDVQSIVDTFVQLIVVASKIPGSTLALTAFSDEVVQIGRASTTLSGIVASLDKRIADNVARVDRWGGAAKNLSGFLDNLASDLEKTRGKTVEFGDSARNVVPSLTSGSGLAEGMKKVSSAAKELVKRVNESAEAGHKIQLWVGRTMASLNAFSTKIATDQLAIQMRQLDATTKAWMEYWKAIQPREGLTGIPDTLLGKPVDIGPDGRNLIPGAPPPGMWDQFSNSLDGLARSMSQLGQVTDSVRVRSMSAFVTALDLASKAGVSLREAFVNVKTGVGNVVGSIMQMASAAIAGVGSLIQSTGSGSTKSRVAGGALAGAAIGTSILPGWGTAIGAAAGAITGWLRGRNQGRNMIEDWSESQFGGFENLQAKMVELGQDTYDRLWRQLNEVGRGNTEQAEAAIRDITAAFQDQERKATDATRAIVDAAAQQREALESAAAPLQARLADLNTEYSRLFDSIKNEAPEEVMGVIESQTRARMQQVDTERVKVQSELEQLLASFETSMQGVTDVLKDHVGIAARDMVTELEDTLSGARIRIPIEFAMPDVPALGSGGIVRRPTLALIGESGPEAVVPLGGAGPDNGSITVNTYLDGDVIARSTVRRLPRELNIQGIR